MFGTQVTVVPDARRVARGTSADPEVISQIAAGVGEGNAKLSRVEQIKRFRVLPTFWEPGGDEITLTMKLKRKPINEKYAAEIEELYASELGRRFTNRGDTGRRQRATRPCPLRLRQEPPARHSW